MSGTSRARSRSRPARRRERSPALVDDRSRDQPVSIQDIQDVMRACTLALIRVPEFVELPP
jgi:hypothetical protein